MAAKTSYFCQNCGTQHSKWKGQCNSCKKWNTLNEEVIEMKAVKVWETSNDFSKTNKPLKLNEILSNKEKRIKLLDHEFNRVLGGGIVPGSVLLLGGDPGIGKSTLMLQIALQLNFNIVYVSGEESQNQIKLRASRMAYKNSECYILCETNTKNIFHQIKQLKPKLLIVDSIQTLESEIIPNSAGSVSQIKQTASELISFAKITNIPVFLIGHITKGGDIAGPKILEHMVDTVIHFEGDTNNIFRILRAKKNRFGPTDEIGIYEMVSEGLKGVKNPSELLLSNNKDKLIGQAIGPTVEGIRPFLVEIQALVSSAVYGTPQRSSTGFNTKRLNMLLAVLEKKAGFALGSKDVFINITGGISIDDPAMDLAVIIAILSSHYDISINSSFCFAAEIGLSGELRPVSKINLRVQEAYKLGFESIYVAKNSKIELPKTGIKINYMKEIEDVVKKFFSKNIN